MTEEQARWVVQWCTETGSLLFLWHGKMGTQPVLMPGFTYYWWLDDDSALLHKDGEGASGSGRAELVH